MKTLTMTEWAITTRAEAIFTATRGPEDMSSNGFVLKAYTTSRIRAFIKDWGYGEVRHKPLSLEEQKRRNSLLETGSLHFKIHYLEAVYAIETYCDYDLIEESEIKLDYLNDITYIFKVKV